MDEFVKATLDWCNERRAEKGMEPLDDLPKGVRTKPDSCPCGKATGLAVGLDCYSENTPVGLNKAYLPLPPKVTVFVRRFDLGDYPQYEEGREDDS